MSQVAARLPRAIAIVLLFGCDSGSKSQQAPAEGSGGGMAGAGTSGGGAGAATGGRGGSAGPAGGSAGPATTGGAGGQTAPAGGTAGTNGPARDAGTGVVDARPSDVGVSPSSDAGTSAEAGAPGSDPAPGQYGTRAPMLAPNSEMAVAAVDGKIYVLGGYPSSGVHQQTLQVYDVATNKWSPGTPYPIPIHHPVTVGVNGKLYSLGGQPDTAKSFEYDPQTGMWRELMPMKVARGGGAGAAIGNKIYVVGGRPPAANAFEAYDIATNTWETLPPLPARFQDRNHLAAVAIGGKIYVAGGRYNGGGFGDPRTDALEMYDPGTNMWSPRKNMLRPRGGVSGVAAFGCFHVYGGEGRNIGEPNDVYPDHDVYNPMTDTWTALPKLPVPFHGATGGAFVDGIIFMPGGGTRSGGSSGTVMHQVYRPDMRCE